MGLFLPSIVQQYAKVDYFSGVVQKYYVIQLHNSLVQCHKYCSSVLSVIVKQLQQLSTLSYSTIATIVQCSQLQYNSYRSLGAILRFFWLGSGSKTFLGLTYYLCKQSSLVFRSTSIIFVFNLAKFGASFALFWPFGAFFLGLWGLVRMS